MEVTKINGYVIKDTTAREEIEIANKKIDNNFSSLNNKIEDNVSSMNNKIDSNISSMNTEIDILNANIESGLSNISNGTPLIVSSIAEMTDTSRIYVNTSDGHWYYYNGTSWIDGGLYQSSGIENGSIDYLHLNQLLSETFKTKYTDINLGEPIWGKFVSISNNAITKNDAASYGYYKANLEANKIYLISSFQVLNIYGYILVDEDDNILECSEIPTNDNTGYKYYIVKPTQNCYCYMNLRRNMSSPVIDNIILINTNIKQLNKIESLYTDFKNVYLENLEDDIFENQVYSYCFYNHNYLGVPCIDTSESQYKLHKFSMYKGETYKLRSIDYGNIVGILITDYAGNPTYRSTESAVSERRIVDYEFKATYNGYIYICEDTNNSGTSYLAQKYVPYNTEVLEENAKFKNKIITCLGDSIVEGAGTSGGYPSSIGRKLTNAIIYNKGVSGSTIALGTGRRSIAEKCLTDLVSNSDICTIGGGWNDWALNVPIGAITQTYTDTIDNTTFIGALEYIFRNIKSTNSSLKIIYILTHNVNDDSYQLNSNNLTYKDYIKATKEVCNKYGIPVVDLFNESQLNTGIENLKVYTNESDGLHPTSDGYDIFYTPIIIEKLKSLI